MCYNRGHSTSDCSRPYPRNCGYRSDPVCLRTPCRCSCCSSPGSDPGKGYPPWWACSCACRPARGAYLAYWSALPYCCRTSVWASRRSLGTRAVDSSTSSNYSCPTLRDTCMPPLRGWTPPAKKQDRRLLYVQRHSPYHLCRSACCRLLLLDWKIMVNHRHVGKKVE